MIKITCAITLAEENLHAFSHVDPQEVIEPADHRGDSGKRDCFCNCVLPEVALAEGGDFEIELDDEGTIQSL